MTARLPGLRAPEPLTAEYELAAFRSGVDPLDDWLKRQARHNETEGGSRTFVVSEGLLVVGYYSLAASSVLHGAATGRARRNMPNPVPMVLLGRLAIDLAWQGKGLGADLMRDAVMRVIAASGTIGVRAMLVHAISAEAKAFYEKHGFRASPVDLMLLMITMGDVRRVLLA